MLARSRFFASGPIVLSNHSLVQFRSPARLPYLGGEQFWGRAVRASCDPLDPGRFLFVSSSYGSRQLPTSSFRISCPRRLIFNFEHSRFIARFCHSLRVRIKDEKQQRQNGQRPERWADIL
jgi:hypothetical protein